MINLDDAGMGVYHFVSQNRIVEELRNIPAVPFWQHYWMDTGLSRNAPQNRINIKVTQKCGSFPLEIIWAIWPSKFTDEEWFKMLVPSVFDAYV